MVVRPGPAPPYSRTRTLVLSLVISMLWSVLCAAILQLPLWLGEIPAVALPLLGVLHPLDLAVVWLVQILVISVIGRLWLSLGVVLILVSAVSAVNAAKLSVLTEPLFPSDVAFVVAPGFLVSMVPVWAVPTAIGAATATIAAFVLIGRCAARLHDVRSRSGRLAVVPTATATSVLAALMLTTSFQSSANPWRKAWESTGAGWVPYSQVMNYRGNGFIGGFLYNLPVPAMDVPPGYSEATMQEISTRYRAASERANAGREAGAARDVNIVLLLSESLGDPASIRGLTLGEDPLTRTRGVMKTAWSGTTLASYYGTGTSNMEFQALTGLSSALFRPQVVSPYQAFVADQSSFPSAVSWLQSEGHEAVTVHPYTTEMYKRRSAYRTLGFDDFVYDTSMSEQDTIQDNPYISDRSAFNEVLAQIDTRSAPLLINLVTMQNHVPTAGSYGSPVSVRGAATSATTASIGGWARGISYSDVALVDFLDELENRAEPTVVVMYGDHLPGILDERLLAQNRGLDRQQTPLLLWSSEGQKPRDLGIVGPPRSSPWPWTSSGRRFRRTTSCSGRSAPRSARWRPAGSWLPTAGRSRRTT